MVKKPSDSETVLPVVTWLRSPEGVEWSSRQHRRPWVHEDDSGMFADVTEDGSMDSYASWPDPGGYWLIPDD